MITAFLEVYETVARVFHNFIWSVFWGAFIAYLLGMTFHSATGFITLSFSVTLVLDFLMFSHIRKKLRKKLPKLRKKLSRDIDNDSDNYNDK